MFARQLPVPAGAPPPDPMSIGGLGVVPLVPASALSVLKGTEGLKMIKKHKRAGDWGTAGGNAYTGATGDVSGGTIINDGSPGSGDSSSTGVSNTGGSKCKCMLSEVVY